MDEDLDRSSCVRRRGRGPAVAPDMQADRYLLQAEEQIERRNFDAAKQSLDRILALQDQHGLELPEEFFFATPRSSNGSGSTTKRSSP